MYMHVAPRISIKIYEYNVIQLFRRIQIHRTLFSHAQTYNNTYIAVVYDKFVWKKYKAAMIFSEKN